VAEGVPAVADADADDSSRTTAHDRGVAAVRAVLFPADAADPSVAAAAAARAQPDEAKVDRPAAVGARRLERAPAQTRNRRGSNNPRRRINGPLVPVLVQQLDDRRWQWSLPATGEWGRERFEYAARRASHAAAARLTSDEITRLCPDGLTGPEAEVVLAVSVDTIRASWESDRNDPPHLVRLPTLPDGRPRYALSDLLAVEARTRTSGHLPGPQRRKKRRRR
jgi:hypothetical protein